MSDDRTREQILADALEEDAPAVFKELMKLECARIRKRIMEPSVWRQIFPPIELEIIDDPERQEC